MVSESLDCCEWHQTQGVQYTTLKKSEGSVLLNSTFQSSWVYTAAVRPPSHVRLFATTWTAACQASPSFTISPSLLKLMPIESVMPSNLLILCFPLFLLPSIFSSIKVFPMSWLFASGSQSIEVSASASFLPINIQDWFPLGLIDFIFLQSKIQKILKNLFQYHSSKASIFRCSAFFLVQLSHCAWLLEKM